MDLTTNNSPVSLVTTLFKTSRPPFLLLTPACLFVGYAIALSSEHNIHTMDLFIVLLGALSAHISVNTFNEYFDFKSGLDTLTSKTPFSGGSGGLLENPHASGKVLKTAIISLLLTVAAGCYFIFKQGPVILPIGIAGVLLIIFYTTWINRKPLLCLLAPGLAFGPLMIAGTHSALTGEFALNSLYLSLVPFFQVNNLLLLNQFPDIDADKTIGRKHFPITYGLKSSTYVYGLFVALATICLVLCITLNIIPQIGYAILLSIFPGAWIFLQLLKYSNEIEKLLTSMAINALVTITTPVLIAIAILFS